MAKAINKKVTNATRKNGVDKDKLQKIKTQKSSLQSVKTKTVDKSKLQSIKSTKPSAANQVKDYLGVGNGYLKAVAQTNKVKRDDKKANKTVPLKTYKDKKTKKK